MLQLENNVSRIDEAIDKALEEREKNQESVYKIIEDFIIDEVVDYLIEDDMVTLKVSEAAGDVEDKVLIAKKDDITLAVLEAGDFLQLEIGYDFIAKYLTRGLSILSERSDRIWCERSHTKNSSSEFIEYELRLKE